MPGALVIAEYLDETRGASMGEYRLMPLDPVARVEVRRIASWFTDKFSAEVSEHLVREKIYKRLMPTERGRRLAGILRDPCGARQHPLSSDATSAGWRGRATGSPATG